MKLFAPSASNFGLTFPLVLLLSLFFASATGQTGLWINEVTDSIVAGTTDLTLAVPASAVVPSLRDWASSTGPKFADAWRNDSLVLAAAAVRTACKDIAACLVAEFQSFPCYAYVERLDSATFPPIFAEAVLVDVSLGPSRPPAVSLFSTRADLRAAVSMLHPVCSTQTTRVVSLTAQETEEALEEERRRELTESSLGRRTAKAALDAPANNDFFLVSIGSTVIFQSPSPDLNTTVVGLVLAQLVSDVNAAAASNSSALLEAVVPATKELYDSLVGTALQGDNTSVALVDVTVAQEFSPISPTRRPIVPSGRRPVSPGALAGIVLASLAVAAIGAGLVVAMRRRRLRQLGVGGGGVGGAASGARGSGGRFMSLGEHQSPANDDKQASLHHHHHHHGGSEDHEQGSGGMSARSSDESNSGGGKKEAALLKK